jgi:hypothetical protein
VQRLAEAVTVERAACAAIVEAELQHWLAESKGLAEEEQVGYPPFHMLKIKQAIEARGGDPQPT